VKIQYKLNNGIRINGCIGVSSLVSSIKELMEYVQKMETIVSPLVIEQLEKEWQALDLIMREEKTISFIADVEKHIY
jgi:hypothetical protein